MKVKLSIVLIGTVNSGKSSLINALLEKEVAFVNAQGGATKSAESFDLKKYNLNSEKLSLEIIDTPGLSEVEGEKRANIAANTASKGDLILFVINSDLKETEKATISRLSKINKPILLILNQIDRYSEEEMDDITNSLAKNVKGLIGDQDIVLTAASPVQKFIVIDEHGMEREEERIELPEISDLKSRIEIISNSLGKHIDHIAGYHGQWKIVNQQISYTKILKEQSYDTAFNYSVMIGVATAINPFPLIDMIGGTSGVAMMMKKIANIYDVKISMDEAASLSKELLQGVVIVMGSFSALVLGAGSLLKTIPYVGWAIGGVTQATSVAFIALLIGDTVNDYFANGQKWESNNSLKESLEKKMASIDKDEVTNKLKAQINSKLRSKAV